MSHTLASVSVSQSVQNLLNTVAHSLPKIAVFLLVMVVGWIIATVVRRVVQALLHKLNFDRVAERGAIGPALSSRGYSASGMLARLVYYAVLLVTLQLAFGVFGPNPVSTMLNGMVSWLPKAFVAIILVVIASAIAKVVKDLLGATLGGLSYGRFVASTAAVFIIALGVIAALNQIDVAASVTTPVLIAVLATTGAILAIGIGGGMVRPMEQRWERMLTAAERDTSSLAAYQRGRQDALSSPGAVTGPDTGQREDVYASHSSQEQGGYAGQESSGYAGQESSGYGPQESSGYAGQQRAGYRPQESSGYAGQESSGYTGQQRAGYRPQESSGYAGYGAPEPGGYTTPQPGGYAGPPPSAAPGGTGEEMPRDPQARNLPPESGMPPGPGMPPPQHH